ncbi:hypothetical protein MMC31_004719 [Peltigera leucophlebia]|nr:hypothetical protein [Peltigera leucophlebia]
MRAHCFILATWIVVSVHSTPIQNTEYQERNLDSSKTPLKEGQQVASPCPDLIDPQTGSTALYFYHGQTREQRRATQFVNDHWGLPSCCDSQVHSCTSPPDPQPLGSPCPTLKDENGNLLSLYGNPYTTDQIAANYILLDSLSRNLCPPNKTDESGASIISLSTTRRSKTQTERDSTTGELIVDPAHGLSSGSSARPLADLPSSEKNLARIGTTGKSASDANALAPGELTIDPIHGLSPVDST